MPPLYPKVKPNPLQKANLCSRLFFWWLNPLFKIGHKRKLEEDDMYPVLPEDRSQHLGEELQGYWDQEVSRAQEDAREPSLTKSIIKCYGKSYLVLGMLTFLEEGTRVVKPIFLGKMISYVENYDPNDSAALHGAYGYAAGLSASVLVWAVLHHLYFYHIQHVGMRLRVAVCHMIYHKTLRLSSSAMGKTTTGQVVNLLSNNVNRLDQKACEEQCQGSTKLSFFHVEATAYQGGNNVLALSVDGATAGYHSDRPALDGNRNIVSCWDGGSHYSSAFAKLLWDVVFITPVFMFMFLLSYKHPKGQADLHCVFMKPHSHSSTCDRKVAGGEEPSAADLDLKMEISKILRSSYLRSMNLATFFAVSKIMIFVTFITSELLDNLVTGSQVFVVVTLFEALRFSSTLYFPMAVEKVSEAVVSIRRIKKFLLLDETSQCYPQLPSDGRTIVDVQAFTASWEKASETPTLQGLSFTVRPGELLAVVGPVGAGKLSLLSAVLGELPPSQGKVNVHGRIAYVSQQPWLFPGTVKSNILFGKKYEKEWYEEVIQACALKKDLQLLEEGDLTEIGDGGTPLSEGQKARVSLARALYQDADIYLLDDLLSAVDTGVSGHLFEQCICQALKNKITILVTHQFQYLQDTSQILALKNTENIQVTLSLEDHLDGKVGFKTYKNYFTAGAGWSVILFLILVNIAAYVAYILQDWWLADWANVQGDLYFEGFVKEDEDVVFILNWYLGVYSGRILNRFSKDIGHMDDLLPVIFQDFIQTFLLVVGVVGVMVAAIPWTAIPVIPLGIIFFVLRWYFLRTSRDVTRLECTTQSPVFSHLAFSLRGLWTIRAYKAEQRLQELFDAYQDLHSEAWFLLLTTSQWLAVYLDVISAISVTVVSFVSLILVENTSHTLAFRKECLSLAFGIFRSKDQMISVERGIEYTDLEKEAPWEYEYRPPPTWPQNGEIYIINMNFRYSLDGPLVLKNMGMYIDPREKHSIVGRTGSGKSSLIAAIFRLSEPEGSIWIDGIWTTNIGLHDLRKKISVAPQVQLKDTVKNLPGKMNTELAESGLNFSVGQRQLVCLARAFLKKNQILIIDKATSNVDPRTDELIQKRIREKFSQCTVLTITHKLSNIIDCERISVYYKRSQPDVTHSDLVIMNVSSGQPSAFTIFKSTL
ncbi:hypothetical protein MG293_011188 [Ovis ammon polii]|uniref:Multidrug resistance-associated protein 4-like n=1 Tax=Ovis ammon polii TaxID=230172 RepID=A0AAD4U5L5_OVIAM|nr:hypothetical protein MG293_011188 [Ovis ammon polii]